MNEEQNIANDPSTMAPNLDSKPRKKTMTKAAIEANRANAQKSSCLRTAAGTARAASNSFQYGL